MPSRTSPSRNSQTTQRPVHLGPGLEDRRAPARPRLEFPDEGHELDFRVGDDRDVALSESSSTPVRLQKGSGIDVTGQGFPVVTADQRFFGGGGGQVFPLCNNYVSNISGLIVSLARCPERLRKIRRSLRAR